VPRIFEKIYTAATSEVEKSGGLKKLVFNWAIGVGKKVRERERAGKPIGWFLRKQHEIADKQVLSKIRGLFGGRIKNCVTGAAPINPEILRFFDAAGVLILEGWGMTETSTAATVARPDAFKFGKVGRAFAGDEIKIADDGEILVRGPNIFQGYYKNEEATRETLVDGWLHTGDIGEFDDDGYLKIVDRKKEIIINAAGKNMSPANIEATLKSASPLIGNAVCIGDAKPYNTALIVLDADFAPAWAAQHGIEGATLESLAHDERIRAAVQEGVDAANAKLARVEQIKKFVIVEGDWLPGGDELTPTMKLKRKPIAEKYESAIGEMYA
jgi:long-subunit acyl-CoA synthetase (AMP-forming)